VATSQLSQSGVAIVLMRGRLEEWPPKWGLRQLGKFSLLMKERLRVFYEMPLDLLRKCWKLGDA